MPSPGWAETDFGKLHVQTEGVTLNSVPLAAHVEPMSVVTTRTAGGAIKKLLSACTVVLVCLNIIIARHVIRKLSRSIGTLSYSAYASQVNMREAREGVSFD